MSYSNNNQRIAKNTLFLYIRMFFVLVVSLYISRAALSELGVENFGIYNVVAGFVSLFSFINATLASGVQRFYNYHKAKEGETSLGDIFNTSILINCCLSVILLLALESFGLWYINNVMVITSDRLFAANVVFQCSVASLLLVLFQIPYLGVVLAFERMDFYAYVSIIDIFLKLLAVISISFFNCDNLITYGVLLLMVVAIDLIIYMIYCKRNFKQLRIKLNINVEMIKSMLSFSAWNLVGTFAFMLKNQGVNLVLNFFFGPIVNAARGIAFQVNSAVSSFTSSIVLSFKPQLTESYAVSDMSRTRQLMFIESKVCFMLIAAISIPVVLEMDLLLHFWLGNNLPDNTSIFASLVLVDTLIGTLNAPCTQIVQASGEIKKYQIASSIVNLALIPVSLLFLRIGFSAIFVFILTILFSVLNQIVCLYITNRIAKFGLTAYMKKVILPCLCILIIVPIIPLLISIFLESSLIRLFLITIATIIDVVMVSYFILLTNEERVYVISKIKDK